MHIDREDVLRYLPLAIAIPLAGVALSQLARSPAVRRLDGPVPAPGDPAFGDALHATLGVPLLTGSRVELLQNGDELFPRMWADMEAAQSTISVHTFYWEGGELAEELREILARKAREGIRVRVLYDVLGAVGHPQSAFAELRRSGVEVVALRPPRPRSWHAIHHRSHARYLIIDEEVAYTGGFGFADQWAGSGHRKGEWRDSAVRVEGVLLPALASGFRALWAEASGELITGPVGILPVPERESRGPALALHSSPGPISTPVERLFALSIASARERLYLSIAYFVPDPFFIRLLEETAHRGGDVRLLTANHRSDLPVAWWAGRRRYERLLAARVRIFEDQPSMMHAKTLVVDGRWSVVGAMNLDYQSLTNLDESLVGVLDGEFGREMEEVFHDDLSHAKEIRLEEFRRRPLHERAIELGASAMGRLV
jgi:cardiolipin synthase A/B